MSVLSSEELEERGVCFYLSSHVYQRALVEPAEAFLLPEQTCSRCRQENLLLLPRLLSVGSAAFLSSSFFPALVQIRREINRNKW